MYRSLTLLRLVPLLAILPLPGSSANALLAVPKLSPHFSPVQQFDPGVSVLVDRVLESPLIVLIAGGMFFLSLAAVIMVVNQFRQTGAQIKQTEAMNTQSATFNVQVVELGRMVGQVGALQSAIANGDKELVEKIIAEMKDRNASIAATLQQKLTTFQSEFKSDYDRSAEERTKRVETAIHDHDTKDENRHDTVVALLQLLRGQVRDDNKVLVDELTRKLEERQVIPPGAVPEAVLPIEPTLVPAPTPTTEPSESDPAA